jgi:hypothetical protein
MKISYLSDFSTFTYDYEYIFIYCKCLLFLDYDHRETQIAYISFGMASLHMHCINTRNVHQYNLIIWLLNNVLNVMYKNIVRMLTNLHYSLR